MEPSRASTSVLFPTVQSGAYASYNVLAMGPCHKASEIFSRHSDALCFGTFSGPNTAFVDFTPLGIASMKTQVPPFQQQGAWGTPYNNMASSKASSIGLTPKWMSVQQIPPTVPPTCAANYAVDPTLAPAITHLSYGTYFNNANAGKSCNMTSFAGSCSGNK